MHFESLTVDKAGAGAVTGLTSSQISNWVQKFKLFPEKRRGSGVHFMFSIGDVVTLAVVKALTEVGFGTPDAAAAVRSYSPYGAMLHGAAGLPGLYPGTFAIYRSFDGQWCAAGNPDKPVALHLHVWPIFERVLPGFCDVVREQLSAVDADRLDETIEDYVAAMDRLKHERFSDDG